MRLARVCILAEADLGSVFVWTTVLIMSLLVLLTGVMLYRRWMNAPTASSAGSFTLSDLRKLHREGKMTQEEFEKAKAIIIGSYGKSGAPESGDSHDNGQGPRKTGGNAPDVTGPT